MKILLVDIGTGTQDILLYDSTLDIENGYKLILPSPTMIIHRRLKESTRRGEAVLLTGVTMGGGPSQWAAQAHIQAGYPVYATPAAARTFNDDPQVVQEMGIQVISEDEAIRLPSSVTRLELKDFDFDAIARSFAPSGVSLLDLDAVAVAVFDHGNAPPEISDRQFRFDYLDHRIRAKNRLSAFAYLAQAVPPDLTRLQAVVDSAKKVAVPLVVMDTAPAAVLGATFDLTVASCRRVLVVNVGNFHTLAFRMSKLESGIYGIEGVFEHHTGLIDLARLEQLLRALADGSIKHRDVFAEHGHGALIYDPDPLPLDAAEFDIAVTGPRWNLFLPLSNQPSQLIDRKCLDSALLPASPAPLRPYFAVPFGDMMIAGCIGLLAAVADLLPDLAGPIRSSLHGTRRHTRAPWDNI